MANTMSHGARGVSPPQSPTSIGKVFLLGSAVVVLGLSSVWMSMSKSVERQERMGTNPTYEQVLKHFGTTGSPPARLDLEKQPQRQRAEKSALNDQRSGRTLGHT